MIKNFERENPNKSIINYTAFILLFFSSISAQTEVDSTRFIERFPAGRLIFSQFEKQLNTYKLNTAFKYGLSDEHFSLGINQRFRSTIVKSNQNNIKDEQLLSVLGEYKFNRFISLGAQINNNIYSDDRKIAINEAFNLYSTIFSKYSPARNISFIPFGGYANNRQIGEVDTGPIYGTEAVIDNLVLSDMLLYSSFRFQNEDISPRKNTFRIFNINAKNQFQESVSNYISARYYQQRKDFYFEADSLTSDIFNVNNNIQSRVETGYFLQDRLQYQAVSGLAFDFRGRAGWRDIDRFTRYIYSENITSSSFDTKIEEFNLDFSGQADLRTGLMEGFIKLAYSEREERHNAKYIENADRLLFEERQKAENRKNNKSQIITLSGAGTVRLSPENRLSISLLHRKLIYDTPSIENFDDRDELLTVARIMLLHQFNPFFSMNFNIEGSINHIVYIFAARSSNNNIRRVIKLSTAGDYRNKYFSSSNSAEVSANYTVYDFEDINPNIKSFSFRQFVLKDSTNIYLNRRIDLNFYGYLRLSEQGDFDWGNFTGRPFRDLEELYLEPKFVYKISRLRLGLGLRYFSLITFSYDSKIVRSKSSEYRSIGPLSDISFSPSDRVEIKLYGWYEFIKSEDNSRRELVNMNFFVNWSF